MQIICLDPGHGGDDLGARNAVPPLSEKDIVLEMARAVGRSFRQHPWQITMTRIDDRPVTPAQRAFRANRSAAVCCISLHCGGADCAAVPSLPAGLPASPYLVYQGGQGDGYRLVDAIHHRMAVLMPPATTIPILAAPRWDLLRWCSIPTVIVVAGILHAPEARDTVADCAWQAQLGEAICQAVLSVFP